MIWVRFPHERKTLVMECTAHINRIFDFLSFNTRETVLS
jgi:hypothetical protein